MEELFFEGFAWFSHFNLSENGTYNFSLHDLDVPEQEDLPFSFIVTTIVFYCIVFIAGIIGNVCIIYVVSFSSQCGSATISNFFISSTAVSDILLTVGCIPLIKISSLVFESWPFGPTACSLAQYTQWLLTLQKSFNVIVITCDRYYIVVKPFKRRISKRSASVIVISTYILAATITLPTALTAKVVYVSYEEYSIDICTEIWASVTTRKLYSYGYIFLQAAMPMVVMVASNIHIVKILITRKTPGEADPKRDKVISSSKRKSVKILATMVISFAISWIPSGTLTVIAENDTALFNEQNIYMAWILCQWLTFSNCVSNPILYCCISQKFKNGYKEFFLKLITCCKAYQKGYKTKGISTPTAKNSFNSNSTYMRYSFDLPCRNPSRTEGKNER